LALHRGLKTPQEGVQSLDIPLGQEEQRKKSVEILLEKHNDYENNNTEVRIKKILSGALVALTDNSSKK
jgi:hypothetical protein